MDDAKEQAGQAESLKAKEKASKVDGGGETNENQFNRSSATAASARQSQTNPGSWSLCPGCSREG